MSTENPFKVRLCSDLDYEEMVVDIVFEGDMCALISRDKDIEEMEIEIFAPPEGTDSWKFPLGNFISAIDRAKKVLSYPPEV